MKFCKYCNAQLEDDAKYCYDCGASQQQAQSEFDNAGGEQSGFGANAYSGQQYTNQQYNNGQQYGSGQQYNNGQQYNAGQQFNAQPQYMPPAPVKKTKTAAKVAIGVVCGVIAFFVAFVGAIMIFSTDSKEINPEYTQFLDKYGLTETVDRYLMDDENNATIEKYIELSYPDDILYSMEYECSGDSVKKTREILFYGLSKLTDSQVSALESSIKESYSKLYELKCCQVSYFLAGDDYYAVMVDIDYASGKTSLSELYKAGVIEEPSADYISYSKTIESKGSNVIKKYK